MRSLLCCFLAFTHSALFCLAHDTLAPGVQVETLVKTTQSWDGNALPAYPEGTPEITVLHITVPPQTKLPLHLHPVINVGYLLSGELTVVTQMEETLHLKAGDTIVELVDKLHYGMNEGEEPAVIVVVYAGVVGTPVTVLHPEEADH